MTLRVDHQKTRPARRGVLAGSIVRAGLAGIVLVAAWMVTGMASNTPAGADTGAWAPFSESEPHVIEVTGRENIWHVRYPGADGMLGTADDIHGQGDLHVPAGVDTHLVLQSRDYIYNLRLPHLNAGEVAIPGLAFALDIREDQPGAYPLESDPMCGRPHSGLAGRLIVGTERAYRSALHGLRTARTHAE